ncbi:PaaI family thioesterase [Polymorphobacter sp.]|uniref:PaaI family thioesterase n=1 Tax=Polymorphobacter sp. TaxID=1909290 RepID=UPI003F7205E1
MTDAELLAELNRRGAPTAVLLGEEVLALDSAAGTVRVRFQPSPECRNARGQIQGGIVVAMLDDAAFYAAVARAGARITLPSIEMKTSFLFPAPAGVPLYAEGRCLKLGRRVAFMEADLFDEAGTMLARLSTTGVPMPLAEKLEMVERI